MPKIKKEKPVNLHEVFPDRKFTVPELKKLNAAIQREGGRIQWLASKGFVSLTKDGRLKGIVTVEGMNGLCCVKGIDIHYQSDVPFYFWDTIAFPQLDSYLAATEKGEKKKLIDLDAIADTMKTT